MSHHLRNSTQILLQLCRSSSCLGSREQETPRPLSVLMATTVAAVASGCFRAAEFLLNNKDQNGGESSESGLRTLIIMTACSAARRKEKLFGASSTPAAGVLLCSSLLISSLWDQKLFSRVSLLVKETSRSIRSSIALSCLDSVHTIFSHLLTSLHPLFKTAWLKIIQDTSTRCPISRGFKSDRSRSGLVSILYGC